MDNKAKFTFDISPKIPLLYKTIVNNLKIKANGIIDTNWVYEKGKLIINVDYN